MTTPAAEPVRIVREAFDGFLSAFREVTRRAEARFVERDWRGCESDLVERLGTYSTAVARSIDELGTRLGSRLHDRDLWRQMRTAYGAGVRDEPTRELCKTFFNSISRRVFVTEGVYSDVEFVSVESETPDRDCRPWTYTRRLVRGSLEGLVLEALQATAFAEHFEDVTRDAGNIAREVVAQLAPGHGGTIEAIDLLHPVFYRMKHAYLVGRIRSGERDVPLVIALLHDERGVHVDAVLTDPSEVSILFSFTRAYFSADTGCPRELVLFLRSILPLKSVAELYLSLGYHKHGKTELYRELQRHLRSTDDLFETATGDRGMVMLVFTLPSYDRVFKIIRDRFPPPKTTTADDVRRRYRMVFERDRVGRLVEAQEFEHLKFPRARFAPELLEELTSEAARTVRIEGDDVVIAHLYTERKVRPLNLFLRETADSRAARMMQDYGAAIKELATANIFPGDFLLKNFGVTRHGRVVFYDYDELCLLTDCRFRRIPQARNPEDEMSAEPWFSVAPNDIFPEEFRRFLGLPQSLVRELERHHGDLFDVGFWREVQERHRRGEVPDFFPYPPDRRIGPPA